ncbi:MAG: hypothetical protein ABI443_11155 [Chthoniobacterales bacterium]
MLKKVLPLILVLATVAPLCAAVRDHELSITTVIAGANYAFRVPEGRLYASPPWKDFTTPPPLDPGKAATIALAQMKQLFPKISHWGLISITLDRIKDDTRWGHWIYIVQFHLNPDGSGKAYTPVQVPVLMDGSTVQPISLN